MAINETINSIRENIAKAYTSLENKAEKEITINKNLENLSVVIDELETSSGTNFLQWKCDNMKSLQYEFYNYEGTDLSEALGGLDTSNVTTMNNMFDNCYNLTNLDLSNLNTSNVTSMVAMFRSCESLTSLDLSSFDTSNVLNMDAMFEMSHSLEEVDLSSFDTSNTIYTGAMFMGCKSLTSLDLSSFDTSNVLNMDAMFEACLSLEELDLSNFSYKSLLGTIWGFITNCGALTTLKLGSEIPPVNDDFLINCIMLEKILVPKGMLEAYQTATNLSNFAEIMEEYE